jgi:hypothetical protein
MVIENPRSNVFIDIKEALNSLEFDCVNAAKDETKFFKRLSSVNSYPRMHLNVIKRNGKVIVYFHIDYKVHSKQVVLYDERILKVNIFLRGFLKDKGYKVTDSRKNYKKYYSKKHSETKCR